ncbi:hypothetical protein KAR26_04205 [Candidatus Parcubacteria bacterium]|nr:hypothetical protein [Candidatus Parcubacteria bacterium]
MNTDHFLPTFLIWLVIIAAIFGFGYKTASGYPISIDNMNQGHEYIVIAVGEGEESSYRYGERKFQYLVLETGVMVITLKSRTIPPGLVVGDTIMMSTNDEIRITKSFAQGKG